MAEIPPTLFDDYHSRRIPTPAEVHNMEVEMYNEIARLHREVTEMTAEIKKLIGTVKP